MAVFLLQYLAPNAEELRTVKVAYVGGAPLDNALVTRLSALIPNAVIGQMYGAYPTFHCQAFLSPLMLHVLL